MKENTKAVVALGLVAIISLLCGIYIGEGAGYTAGSKDAGDAYEKTIFDACHSDVPVIKVHGESFACLTQDKIDTLNKYLTDHGVGDGGND